MKLEGARRVGFQSILLGSVRDPLIIGQIDDWLDRLRERILVRAKMIYGGSYSEADYLLHIRVYGKTALSPLNFERSNEALVDVVEDANMLAETTSETV